MSVGSNSKTIAVSDGGWNRFGITRHLNGSYGVTVWETNRQRGETEISIEELLKIMEWWMNA